MQTNFESTARNRFALRIFILTLAIMATGINAVASQLDIVGPTGSGTFGTTVTALPNGNIVVVDPGFDAPGPIADVGAVYLYDGRTGAQISVITGSTASDGIGSGTTGITVLANGDFVIRSANWDNGAATNAGAATYCSATTGCSGVVSGANSIVGSTASDSVGSGGIVALGNGNYVIRTPNWDAPGPVANVGAVTFCSGSGGCAGAISATNSLVGTTASDTISNSGFNVLPNNNYLVNSSGSWDNGAASNAGAVTFCSGTTGCIGTVSASNSLIGSTASDGVGTITILTNGNYVVTASNWDNGTAANSGSATFCNAVTGCVGPVSGSNSLIGATAGDGTNGTSVTPLGNGNYVVRIPGWDNGTVLDAGATVFCDGTTGCAPGPVTTSNALHGTSASDGSSIVVNALTNNNYVVATSGWDNGVTTNVGAATFCSGTTGCVGAINALNSLIGSTAADQVGGSGIIALSNGNYVVRSALWNNGAATTAGAATWCSGISGCTPGAVTPANSLVGSTVADGVGQFGATLSNGNYVIRSTNWDNGAIANAGAVTFGDGVGGTTVGPVTPANSLVGSTMTDQVGTGVLLLPNGNFVITSVSWDNGAIVDAGAATLCSGTSGCPIGSITPANSLVGSTGSDQVGLQSAFAVGTSNYLVRTTNWDNGASTNVGAVTWCSGSTGCVGPITTSNSFIGATAADGLGTVTVLNNGNYMISSNLTDNGAITDAGSITWGNGNTGVFGAVSTANSVLGSTNADQISSAAVSALPNGNFLARSTNFDNGPTTQAGAISYFGGNAPTVGVLSNDNGVLGTVASGAGTMVSSVSTLNETLVVGRPASNTVTIFNPTYVAGSSGSWSSASTWNYGANTAPHENFVPNGLSVALDTIATVNSLRVDCTGAITGAGPTAYVIGAVRKDYCSVGVFNFPVGTANGFSPIEGNVTSLPTNPSSLTVSANQTVHPVLVPTISLKRFWTTSETGDLSAVLGFKYLDPTDISAIESTYKLYRVANAEATQIPSTISTISNTISTSSAVAEFSEWAVGNLTPLVADGTIDVAFGNSGVSTVDFDGNPTPGQNDSDFGLDVAVQQDGKIVVSGESFVSTTDSAFSAMRLNADGTVDTSFGNSGRFLFNVAVGIAERAYGVAVQTDGKIILAGRTNSPRNRIVMRLNSDGTFDNSFGTNGIFQTPTGNTIFDEEEIAIQPDGKIIVIGSTRNGGLSSDAFSVMRLTTSGSLDSTFDGDGEAITVFSADDRAYGVVLQPDGKIVVSGSSNNNGQMALARYNPNGTLDSTFDSDGKVTIGFSGATSLAYNVTLQPDGKIVAGGYIRNVQADGAVVRFNPNGSVDTSFSGDGVATFGSTTNELFWDVHVRNGKIVATGFRALPDPSSVEDFMIVRFRGDGVPDTTFGNSGAVFVDINNTRDDCLTSAFAPDGKLVLAGYSSTVSPFNPDFAVIKFNFASQKTPADFDGDGKSDISVYRTIGGGTSQWWIQQSGSNSLRTAEWGLEGDIPTPADFDGDGKTDIAVWRPAPATQAKFYILNSADNTLRQEVFGQIGDNPRLVADYDGDGKSDPAVYREGAQSVFYYRGSSANPNGDTTYIQWGTVGDKPVAGDFNGDGRSDFAVFRSGEWWILRNATFVYDVRGWGVSTDTLVPGDYDGDGKTDLAVFRPSDGVWYVQNSSNGSASYQAWGVAGDKPAPADYDGDGKTDRALCRDGVWYILQSSGTGPRVENFGIPTDTAIPGISVVP